MGPRGKNWVGDQTIHPHSNLPQVEPISLEKKGTEIWEGAKQGLTQRSLARERVKKRQGVFLEIPASRRTHW